jgi:hypothetical protein
VANVLGIDSLQRTRRGRKSAGQSLVEFTIMLPILMMLLSGLIEFGFLLNMYLDVIDAAREAARSAANSDPNDSLFFNQAFINSRGSLFTASDGRINWIPSDPSDCTAVKGDIVVSAFAFLNNSILARYPGTDVGRGNCPANGYLTKFSDADINAKLDEFSIGNSGAVMVEIYFEYEMVLGLPWITEFVPDPVILHAYTIMPNTYAEPGTDSIILCHKAPPPPGTMRLDVGDPAVAAHLAHGDTLGTC